MRPAPLTVNAPAVTITLPALPVAAGAPLKGPSALLEISPPSTTDKVPAVTVTRPALPALPASASETMPDPSIVNSPATVTETSPALPAAKVLLEISLLARTVRPPALTLTWPACPVLPGSASLRMPVGDCGFPEDPSIVNSPPTTTETSPASPPAKVLLEIKPLARIVSVPAAIVTLPAAPAPPALVLIALELRVRLPAALTCTLPPAPDWAAEKIRDPATRL